MEFSPYQKAIFDWVTNHEGRYGALIVEAVAGSGKTTTIVEAAKRIPASDKAVFLAFNKSIATELKQRLPGHVESKTLNALGWALLRRRLNLSSDAIKAEKTRNLCRRHLPDKAKDVFGEIISLVAKAKSHGLVPLGHPTPHGCYIATEERWQTLMERYDIDPGEHSEGELIAWTDDILRLGIQDTSVVDFDDQLYLPVALDLGAWRYDWVMVDEAQDVSHVQRALLRKFLKSRGRIIAVGDPHQAIYGFRGADAESMQNMARVFKAERLPLSISYRCPRKIVEQAQRYVSHIQCSETADDGEVLHPKNWAIDSFGDEDLVVCRNTAPLVKLAYRCIAEGRPVRVLGREIGKGLIAVVDKLTRRKDTDLAVFWPMLDAWRQAQVAKADENEAKINAIMDKVECLNVLGLGLAHTGELIAAINKIFDDDDTGFTLATVHKAKGLEAPRVFVLEPSLMPSPWARQAWQQEQENNLCYVAATRALESLYYLPLENVA